MVWYTPVSIPESKQFADMFEKQYPFIKADFLRSGSAALVHRIVSEYAARNYAVDVMQGTSSRGGLTAALKQRNILGRYESPKHKFLATELKDKNGYWASTFLNTFVLLTTRETSSRMTFLRATRISEPEIFRQSAKSRSLEEKDESLRNNFHK